jgi:hypothetical protein
MEMICEMLGTLVAKTVKNTSQSQVQEGARLLLDLNRQDSDKVMVAAYLCSLHYSVCQRFFELAVLELPVEQIQAIWAAVRQNAKYKQNNNFVGSLRAFATAAVLIKTKHQFARTLLMEAVGDAEKNGLLPAKALEYFCKRVVDYCQLSVLNELGEQDWDNPDQREKYRRLIGSAIGQMSKVQPIAQLPERQSAVAASPEFLEVNSLLKTAQRANEELRTLLRTIINTNETHVTLRKQITDREEQISEKDRKIAELQVEVAGHESTIVNMQAKNDDLKERLAITLQLDTSANNQELITLRTDISNALKLEYQDYLDSKTMDFSPDQYEAFKASLFRIFKTLKRFHINFE